MSTVLQFEVKEICFNYTPPNNISSLTDVNKTNVYFSAGLSNTAYHKFYICYFSEFHFLVKVNQSINQLIAVVYKSLKLASV